MEKVKQVLGSINKIAREDQVLSRLIPQLDLPHSQTVGDVFGALGYGRKKRAPRKTGGAKKKTGGAKKKTGGARKRAPRKRGMGAPISGDTRYYTSSGLDITPDPIFYGPANMAALAPALAPAPAPARPIRPPMSAPSVGDSRRYSANPAALFNKGGKGFGGFLQKLLQAPLAGLAATSGGLHGALGSFGKKKRGGRKMLAVMPPMYL